MREAPNSAEPAGGPNVSRTKLAFDPIDMHGVRVKAGIRVRASGFLMCWNPPI